MSKKGVEGLPLKYIILVIVALLVIDLILEMTGIIRGGIITSLYSITNTTSNISGQI
ncbi:Uncharacterised protein [Candidatus Tiddalikarchaeum anstoanum]|nr:Uncharacterised protein [Candidatus Tiddalikarchaeum anstoanum]